MLAAVSLVPVAAPDTALTVVRVEQLVDRLVLAGPLALCRPSFQFGAQQVLVLQDARHAKAVWSTAPQLPMFSLAVAVQASWAAPLPLVVLSL